MSQTEPTRLIEDAERAQMVLSPIKRRLLEALRKPGSAASLARDLDLPRQQLGYHLRALEAAGLVRLVEERQRRGLRERVLVAAADTFMIDPGLLTRDRAARAQDRHAAGHLAAAAADVVRDVTRMQGAAEAAGQRLLTVTIEAELGFDTPQDFQDFSQALAEAVTTLARRYAPGEGRRGYHLLAGVHPAAKDRPAKPIN